MSREIEFRQWIDGRAYYWGVGVDGFTFVSPTGGSGIHAGNTVHEQYTGLKDCNGVKIFDGDILTAMVNEVTGENVHKDKYYIAGKSRYHTGNKVGAVWTIEHVSHMCFTGYMFYGLNRRFHKPATRSMIVNNSVKVIGNIHQHPHLLEDAK